MASTLESLAALLGESVALSESVAALNKPGRGLQRLEARIRVTLAAVSALPHDEKKTFVDAEMGAKAFQQAISAARGAAAAAVAGEESVGEKVRAAHEALDEVVLSTDSAEALPMGFSQNALAALFRGCLEMKGGRASLISVRRWLETEAPLLNAALDSGVRAAFQAAAGAYPKLLEVSGNVAQVVAADESQAGAVAVQQPAAKVVAAARGKGAPAAEGATPAEMALLQALRALLGGSSGASVESSPDVVVGRGKPTATRATATPAEASEGAMARAAELFLHNVEGKSANLSVVGVHIRKEVPGAAAALRKQPLRTMLSTRDAVFKIENVDKGRVNVSLVKSDPKAINATADSTDANGGVAKRGAPAKAKAKAAKRTGAPEGEEAPALEPAAVIAHVQALLKEEEGHRMPLPRLTQTLYTRAPGARATLRQASGMKQFLTHHADACVTLSREGTTDMVSLGGPADAEETAADTEATAADTEETAPLPNQAEDVAVGITVTA
jgi:hypothetical protein